MNTKIRSKPSLAPHSRSLISSAFLALLVVALLAGCGSSDKTATDNKGDAPSVAVVKVARRDLSNNLEIASEFLPFQEIDVYAKVSGYIQKLYVDWGTHVKQGQLLAVLEIPELQQQLAQDEAAVRRSEQDLERAREELERAQSAYNVAHVTYTRLADVQKSRPELVAQQEIDVAQGKDLEAGAGVSAAKDALACAEQASIVAKAALDKDKAMFDYARMTAPFDGVVTQIYAYTGALLPAGTSSNKGDSALCRLSQNNLLAPGDSRSRKEPCPDIRVGQTLSTSNVSASEANLHREDRALLRTKSIRPRGRCTPKWTFPIRSSNWFPECTPRVKIPLHSATNVLTVPVQADPSLRRRQRCRCWW